MFDIGMNDIITSFEMSSSGDELLMSLPDPEEHSLSNRSRFSRTTEEDRNKLLEESECCTTKRATKFGIKIFKSNLTVLVKMSRSNYLYCNITIIIWLG